MRLALALATLLQLLTPGPALAQAIDQRVLSLTQIAVEKLTGRGDEYDLSFSGWVGSLRFSAEDKRIYIAAISTAGVVTEVYSLTKVENHRSSIEFEATDMTPPFPFRYRGKIWLADDGSIRFEMVRMDSPRRWINLGAHGRRFLHDNRLDRLNLGS